jgi:Recombination endonuclease VII
MSVKTTKDWRANPENRDKILNHRLKKYGITAEDYYKKLQQQNGVCAICGRLPQSKRLRVDHDHINGKIRSLLCMNCNTKLGIIENPKSIFLNYIEHWKLAHR